MSLTATLRAGASALDLSLPTGAEQKLLDYMALLAKWNRTYNLTAVRGEEEMVTYHLLDSLAVLPLVEAWLGKTGISLADVGSGAGLPGLVLAIARPEWEIASVESNQKKAAFQQQARIELGLSNVSIHCARVSSVTGVFSAVISRAFASLADFASQAGHLSSRLLAMKGSYPAAEVAALPTAWQMAASEAIHVPGLDARRHLLLLEKNP